MPTETGCPILVPVSWEISELELGVTSACLAKLFPSPVASTAHSFCVLSPGLAHHRTLSKACGTSLKNAEGHRRPQLLRACKHKATHTAGPQQPINLGPRVLLKGQSWGGTSGQALGSSGVLHSQHSTRLPHPKPKMWKEGKHLAGTFPISLFLLFYNIYLFLSLCFLFFFLPLLLTSGTG